MSDLVDWFTTEIRAIGFAGLEGVYDYVASMPDAQVLEYLESLLGSDKHIVDFANSYLQRRTHGSQPERASDSQTTSGEARGWGQTARAKSKSKRNKGKDRNGGKGSTRNQQDQKTFAKAVSNASSAAPRTKQAQAISDAPVERMRQQVREYRKSKRPVNCIYCGKIECPVKEDGSCSFCGSPIFSVWDPSEQSQRAPRSIENSEATVARDGSRKSKTKGPCLVLGRYIQRPKRSGEVFLQPAQYDLAGRKITGQISGEMEGVRDIDLVMIEKGATLTQQKSAESGKQSKQNTEQGTKPSKSGSASKDNMFVVRGRLLIDEWRPIASLADT